MDIMLLLVGGLVVLLIWRGPKMLPQIGEAFGKTVKGVRENVPSAIKDDPNAGSETSDGKDS